MQIHRLFAILHMLIHQKQVSAKELASRLEVSPRTIYRDVEALSKAGIPVYAIRGNGGGLGILDTYVLDKAILSTAEQQEILAALQSLQAVKDPDASTALAKLRTLFRADTPNWVEIDFSDWSNARQEKFALLKRAILHKHLLLFDYYNSNGEKNRRQVEPLQLLFKNKAWYLWGFCRTRQALRLFKVTRMRALQLLEEHFEAEIPHMPPPQASAPPENHVTLRLRMDASLAHRIWEEFEDSALCQNPDGSFSAMITFPEDEWVYGWLLSFGPAAEVLDPPHIRVLLKERAKKILQLYS